MNYIKIQDALRWEIATYPEWRYIIRVWLFGTNRTAAYFTKKTMCKYKMYDRHCDIAKQDEALKYAHLLLNQIK